MNYQDLFDQAAPKTFKKHSAETRAKMSKNHTSSGMKGHTHSADTRARQSENANPWNKGRTLSAETRDRMKAAAQLRAQKVRQKIMTPNGVFQDVHAVAAEAGVGRATVYSWIKKYPNEYYYVA